ncbi:MAG: pesticidal protein Cry7Aa [bacterium]|nr:pesticidal protein Cry7Aa [bacterium]
MITVKNEGIILEKTNLEFENKAVLNPACIQVDGITHMFYRAINHNNVSSIGYCQLKDNKVVKRLKEPVLFPECDYEKMGVEDPRIVFLDGIYYLFYTAYDGKNALAAYATTSDLVNFKKHGIISPQISYSDAMDLIRNKHFPQRYFHYERRVKQYHGSDVLLWDKDTFIFPKKINNLFWLVHRIMPSIQIATFKDFSELTPAYWHEYLKTFERHILLNPRYRFENHKIGGGCPPIETEAGWLFIYHSVGRMFLRKRYHASVALLDLKNPLKVLGRLKEPLFSPKASWEKSGVTNNVAFPTGAIVRDKRLYIYYGAADKLIAAKSVDLAELLTELKKNSLRL